MSLPTIQAVMEGSGLKTRNTRQGFQCQCPAHNGTSLSLYVSEKEGGKVVMFCHSHHCQPRDILQSIGLTMKELYPTGDNFNHTTYRRQKSQRQTEDECIHAFHVLSQIPVMKASSAVFSDADKQVMIKARNILIENNFTDDDYQRIDREREIDVKYRDFIQRGSQYE